MFYGTRARQGVKREGQGEFRGCRYIVYDGELLTRRREVEAPHGGCVLDEGYGEGVVDEDLDHLTDSQGEPS